MHTYVFDYNLFSMTALGSKLAVGESNENRAAALAAAIYALWRQPVDKSGDDGGGRGGRNRSIGRRSPTPVMVPTAPKWMLKRRRNQYPRETILPRRMTRQGSPRPLKVRGKDVCEGFYCHYHL
ncbi:unnamed protein product [Cuscuta campestris]|uniref:Uncharacterized protein n=1 Tax=Cuscuta campestris TaxID=132261 RepID=A0A484KZR9_9ASTE|nr:unnamed protein product [Cuscuta campestris]